jgi:integrase
MLDCGLRPEEVHRLRWSENIRDSAIEIHTGKGSGSRRRIELTERVSRVFAKLPRIDDWVFPAGTKSGHIEQSSYKKLHGKALADSGVEPFVLYSLRHTCLTRWANDGMNPWDLQKLAGHRHLSTTQKYIHMAASDTQERLAKVRERRRRKLATISDTEGSDGTRGRL